MNMTKDSEFVYDLSPSILEEVRRGESVIYMFKSDIPMASAKARAFSRQFSISKELSTFRVRLAKGLVNYYKWVHNQTEREDKKSMCSKT